LGVTELVETAVALAVRVKVALAVLVKVEVFTGVTVLENVAVGGTGVLE
jgi:hypothetical protein